MFASASASAQSEQAMRACENGDAVVCSRMYFGNCGNENPRVSIPACTRQLGQLGQQDPRASTPNLRLVRALRYAMRGNAYLKEGDLESALSDFEQAVRSHNDLFWAHERRARAYFVFGDYEAALAAFDSAAELNPNDASVLANRALLLAAAPDESLRNTTRSLADARRANELVPGQPAYIDALAVAYASNGDFGRAAEEQQRAIDLLPTEYPGLIDDYRSRLSLYQQDMPFLIHPRVEP